MMDIMDMIDDIEIQEAAYNYIDEYVTENILQMANPKFHQLLSQEICEQMICIWESIYEDDSEDDSDDDDDEFLNDIKVVADEMINRYFEYSTCNWNIPIRSHNLLDSKKCENLCNKNKEKLEQTIQWLKTIPQPVQRTDEWYTFRHGLITASNLSKVFGSDAQHNSLIYEKCQPLILGGSTVKGNGNVNTNTPMHWGQKYEPISIMIYESMYNTSITEFGCIQHPKYPFIGASPDGINCDPEKERYGRMLEVKNIVNREIDGIPSKTYWIQMQIQMETCDLDECDFLETRFLEYPPLDDDKIHPIYTDDTHEYKGIILYFVERMTLENLEANGSGSSPHYEYMPLSISLEIDAVEMWVSQMRDKLRDRYTLYEIKYWYLAEYSCVLVERNRLWFSSAISKIEDTWNTILKERETGYQHRAAKKRVIKNESDDKIRSICLVKLDHD